MPKVRPLTAKQAADQEDKKLSDAILNVVMRERGEMVCVKGTLVKGLTYRQIHG